MTAALQRIDHRSENGVWTLFQRQPVAALAPYVQQLQGFYEAGGRPVLRRELPSFGFPLILVLGPGFTLHEREDPARWRPLARSFLAGLHEEHALVGSEGRSLCMEVNFTPLGAWRFLRCDLQELSHRVLDLAEFFGRRAADLEARLAETPDWPARFALLEEILLARILEAPAEDPRVAAALTAIRRSGGNVPVERLAGALDCSRKHLAALFKRQVGLPPKTVARLARFEAALQRLTAGRVASLAELALDCGYADQAHFNRDFRGFAGETPRAILARTLPDGTGILDAWG